MFLERPWLRGSARKGDPWNRVRKSHVISGMLTQQSADRLGLRALKPPGTASGSMVPVRSRPTASAYEH
jgi:hypothetical protein